jgi:hypothetical protein
MPDGIDPLVEPMEAPGAHSHPNRARGEAELSQLPQRNHPMLAPCKRRHGLIHRALGGFRQRY